MLARELMTTPAIAMREDETLAAARLLVETDGLVARHDLLRLAAKAP